MLFKGAPAAAAAAAAPAAEKKEEKKKEESEDESGDDMGFGKCLTIGIILHSFNTNLLSSFVVMLATL